MSDEPDRRNVYQRLNAIRRQVKYVQKDATVTGGGSYKAVTHDMVTAKVQPHFVEQGVVVVPRLVSSEVVDTGRKTSSGNPIIRYQGRYEVAFVNADVPDDTCLMPVEAHAEDQGDKAPGKALSYATKNSILKVLMLETGEGDESRIPDETPPLTEAEIEGLKKRLDGAQSKEDLRVKLQEVFAVAKEANDKVAHAALKLHAVGVGKKLPEKAVPETA